MSRTGSFFKLLFNVEGEKPENDASPEESLEPPLLGNKTCTENRCGSHEAVNCAYVDRRRRECATAWCYRHYEAVAGRAYCRRHAGVMRALAQAEFNEQLPPDLDNRAPSLCEWVANDLDKDVRFFLTQLLADRAATKVVATPLVLAIDRANQERVWIRSWKLIDERSTVIKVHVMVNELDDMTVKVKVDTELVISVIPPWIQHRLAGEKPSGEQDSRNRAEFRNSILDGMAKALARARAKKT